MSTKPAWVLAVALVVLIPAYDQSDPPGPELPGSGLIAFVPPDPHDVGISLLDPESGQVSRLTTEVRDVTGLAWSPDGTRLAFVLDRHSGIGIIDADGGGLRTLTDPGTFPAKTTFSEATWSPDGKNIAFAAGGVPPNADCSGLDCLRLVRARIYVMDVATTRVTRITDDDLLASSPTWSPDGAQIAFVAIPASELNLDDPPESPQIYVVDPAGDSAKPITSFELSPSQLAWSPDGTSIAFVTVKSDIEVIGPDGGSLTKVVSSVVAVEGSIDNSDPTWSPDGRSLLFTKFDVDGFTIWVAGADGSGERQVHAGCCASWQPLPPTRSGSTRRGPPRPVAPRVRSSVLCQPSSPCG